MRSLSPTEQIRNCEAFLEEWSGIPPERVSPGLESWKEFLSTCGLVSCAGGWLSTMPYFQALGVRSGSWGTPEIPGIGKGLELGYHLFGGPTIFSKRDYSIGSLRHITDHEYVNHRFLQQISSLQKRELIRAEQEEDPSSIRVKLSLVEYY